MKAKNIIILIIALIIVIPLTIGGYLSYQAYQKVQEEKALYQKNITAVLNRATQGEKELKSFFAKVKSLNLQIGSMQNAYDDFKSADAKLHTFSTPKGMESKTAQIETMLTDFVNISQVSTHAFSIKYLDIPAINKKWIEARQLLTKLEQNK